MTRLWDTDSRGKVSVSHRYAHKLTPLSETSEPSGPMPTKCHDIVLQVALRRLTFELTGAQRQDALGPE